jgi:hypothetical protein
MKYLILGIFNDGTSVTTATKEFDSGTFSIRLPEVREQMIELVCEGTVGRNNLSEVYFIVNGDADSRLAPQAAPKVVGHLNFDIDDEEDNAKEFAQA